MISHSKPWIADDDVFAVEGVLRSGALADGRTTKRFATALQSHLGSADLRLTTSGAAALQAGVRQLRPRRGDEVIMPTYVCHEVADAVRDAGAVPILCDAGPAWNMTADSVKERLSDRTIGVVLVHTFGIRAPLADFTALGPPVIEDSCQAFPSGQIDNPGPAPAFSCLSFNATKCLTSGRGGALVSWAGEMSQEHEMDDVHAALGASQLSRYAVMLGRRHDLARLYADSLPPAVTEKARDVTSRSVLFRYPLTVPDGAEFEGLKAAFERAGIAVRRGVDALLHRSLSPDSDYPFAVRAFETTFSLPFYPALTPTEVDHILTTAERVLR